MTSPKISVVIPTYNEAKYLHICLDSLKNQTFKDFELIVADGGSTDETKEIALKYGAKFISVTNSNVVRAREAGLKKARGDIYTGCDADTHYPPTHLETIVREFQKNEKVVAVTGKAVMVNGPSWGISYWNIIYFIIEWVYRLTGFVLYAPAYNLSYKREIFLSLGGYDTFLDFGGDELDVLARLKKVGKIVFTNKICPQTDGRRYKVGFFTFFFKHALFYYMLNYILAKYFRKSLIQAKPIR